MIGTRINPGRMQAAARSFAMAACLLATPAGAALWPGSSAPDFTLTMALAGKASSFSLDQALKRGPVVLYFYPAAFTPGCSIEAHEFAEAIDDFKAVNTTVVGASGDDLATIKRFSKAGCQGRFGVLSDTGLKVASSYDALNPFIDNHADRVSYVITPDRRVYFALSSMNPMAHISATLQAVRRWRAEQDAPAPAPAAQKAATAQQPAQKLIVKKAAVLP